jgi:hypothetical protein
VADGYVYTTATYDQGKGILHIIDVIDPAQPAQVGSVALPGDWRSNIVLRGNYAYVALADCYYFTCSGSLQVIEISTLAQPRLVGSLIIPGGAMSLAMADDGERSDRYVYLAAGKMGVSVVDVSDPTHPYVASSLKTPGYAQDIAATDGLVYVADDQGGLLTLRVVVTEL